MNNILQLSSNNTEHQHGNALTYLNKVCEMLENQTDLSPENSIVTKQLTLLVSQIIDWSINGDLSISDIQEQSPHLLTRLPNLCAIAEYEMEKWWAKGICANQLNLLDFWYFDNYQHLVTSELSLLHNRDFNNIAFLGSGPFPLTAIILSTLLPSKIFICVDRDAAACALSRELVCKLNLDGQIKIIESEAEVYNYSENDLVICASLLNCSDLHKNLHQKNVKQLIIRDAVKLYKLLYKPAQLPDPSNYTEINKTSLQSKCINTSRYFERANL